MINIYIFMNDFLCRVCTFVYIRFFHFPIEWIKKVFDLIDFFVNIFNGLLQVLFRGKPFYWPLKYKQRVTPERRLIVIANGPSLNEDLERLEKEDLLNADYAMLNFSATTPLFLKIKPKYYCLADHDFFKPGYNEENVRKAYRALEELVDWDLTLVVSYNVKSVEAYSCLTNPHIKFQRVFAASCDSFKSLTFKFYKKGLGNPGMGTVTNLAAFAGIQYGYKQIEFCGNDMSFFDGICVSDDNYPCVVMKHYYEDKVTLKPMMISDTKHQTLRSYVEMVYRMIISHNAIADYGKYMGVTFINRTRRSMLDCYPRLIKVHPEEFED